MPSNSLKYPRTPYWPFSPTIGRGDTVHADPERFVGHPVVVTEKLDGSNVLIHRTVPSGRRGRGMRTGVFDPWRT